MAYFLKEDLSEVEYIYIPMIFVGEEEFVKCASFEDIIRGRKELKGKL